jgi:tRNA(fMet)-specific endonuclease VapC
MRFLLDTDTCIYIMKHNPQSVRERFRSLPVEDVGISAITFAELAFGVLNSSRPERNMDLLRNFAAPLAIAPFDDMAALAYAEIRSHLRKAGTPIGGNDLLIGAHAMCLAVTLVTNNTREFARIPGLVIENWTDLQ